MNETGIRREPDVNPLFLTCGDALPRSRKSATGENHRCTHRRVLSVNACFRQLTVPGNRVRAKARGCCPFVTSNRSVRRIILQSYS